MNTGEGRGRERKGGEGRGGKGKYDKNRDANHRRLSKTENKLRVAGGGMG